MGIVLINLTAFTDRWLGRILCLANRVQKILSSRLNVLEVRPRQDR